MDETHRSGEPASSDVTRLLQQWGGGDPSALADLMPIVYGELRRLARRHLREERGDHTLQPTALANEAFLRLVDQDRVSWQSRAHFFAIAAQAMRRVLVDHARRAHAKRRPDPRGRLSLEHIAELAASPTADVIDVDRALGRLTELDARGAQIVELRYFGGLTVEEIAAMLELSPATVNRDLRASKAWLRVALAALERDASAAPNTQHAVDGE